MLRPGVLPVVAQDTTWHIAEISKKRHLQANVILYSHNGFASTVSHQNTLESIAHLSTLASNATNVITPLLNLERAPEVPKQTTSRAEPRSNSDENGETSGDVATLVTSMTYVTAPDAVASGSVVMMTA